MASLLFCLCILLHCGRNSKMVHQVHTHIHTHTRIFCVWYASLSLERCGNFNIMEMNSRWTFWNALEEICCFPNPTENLPYNVIWWWKPCWRHANFGWQGWIPWTRVTGDQASDEAWGQPLVIIIHPAMKINISVAFPGILGRGCQYIKTKFFSEDSIEKERKTHGTSLMAWCVWWFREKGDFQTFSLTILHSWPLLLKSCLPSSIYQPVFPSHSQISDPITPAPYPLFPPLLIPSPPTISFPVQRILYIASAIFIFNLRG